MTQDELWKTWKRLVRLLPMWRMPIEWVASPSMWTLMGVDFLSGLRLNRSSRRIFEILAALSPLDLRRIRALAELNHRRQDVVSRWFAIGFVTLPATAALTLSELSPETLRLIASHDGATSWYWMFAYAGVVVAVYLMSAWRARQLLTLIEMHCIDRGVLASENAESGEDPVQGPLGA